ncbi:MAG: hypothetical protein AAGN82_05300 [Myxococcota bacterium]
MVDATVGAELLTASIRDAGDIPAGNVATAMWSVSKGAPWTLRAFLSTGG